MVWKLIGEVDVDSGTLMIGDPCYFTDDKWTEDDYNKQICWPLESNGFSFPITHEHGGSGKGVFFSTMFGDGSYNVYGDFNEKGRLTAVKVELSGGYEDDE